MRRSWLALAALISACGGGSTGNPAGSDPGTPTSIRIQSGDGQIGNPGSITPTAVVVQVLDAAGQGVAGVTVAFRVDSGGGSITSPSAVTASGGTASPGSWTLGAGGGRNVLTASVANLPSVKIVATATPGVSTIPPQTIGTGGGSMTVVQAGSPINGLKIDLAAGSFSSPQTISITTSPSTGITGLPAGVVVASPIITVSTTQGGYANHPLYITLPTTVPSGMFPVLLALGPSGPLEVLPTIRYSGTSLTAFTRHLDGGLLPARMVGSLRTPGSTALPLVQVLVPASLLYGFRDTGFRLGVDNWEFPNTATVIAPSISSGMIHTETWYYYDRAFNSRPTLYGHFQEAPGLPVSDRRGIRWAAVAEAGVSQHADDGLKQVANVAGTTDRDEMTRLAFLNVRTSLAIFRQAPVLVTLQSWNGGQVEFTVDAAVIAVDRNAPGRSLSVIAAGDPDHEIVIPEPSGTGPINVTIPGAQGTYTSLLAAGLSQSVDFAAYEAQYAKVLDGTIGNAEFPRYKMKVAWGTAAGESTDLVDPVHVFDVANPTTIWADCVTCTGDPRPAGWPSGTATIGSFDSWIGTSVLGPFTAQGVANGLSYSQAATGDKALGLVVRSRGSDGQPAWNDWVTTIVRRLDAAVTPAAPSTSANTDLTLGMSINNPPANLEYEWDFNDAPTKVVTAVANATHKWAANGTYNITVTARDKTTKQPVARAKASVVVQPPLPVWKFTSLTITHERNNGLLNGIEGSSAMQDMYRADSLVFTRARNGASEAGIYLVEQSVTRNCYPACGENYLSEGVYLLETSKLDRTALQTPVQQLPVNGSGPFSSPTAPVIYARPISLAIPLVSFTFCNARPGQSFTRTGDATTGHVTSSYVRFCGGVPQRTYFTETVDITINGDTATGTITKTFDVWALAGSDIYEGTKVMRVNFTATRVQ